MAWDTTNILHVYAQEAWHDDCYIVGGLEALKKLRDQIDKAIESGYSQVDHFVNDGEGYEVHVLLQPQEILDKLLSPYVDPVARNSSGEENRIHPYKLVPKGV